MSQKYLLVPGVVTYVSRGLTFKGGVAYSAETIKEAIDDTDGNGVRYFVGVQASTDTDTAKRTITLGNAKASGKKAPARNGAKDTEDGTLDTASGLLQGDNSDADETQEGQPSDGALVDGNERSVEV